MCNMFNKKRLRPSYEASLVNSKIFLFVIFMFSYYILSL
jgi:hypothetical protein